MALFSNRAVLHGGAGIALPSRLSFAERRSCQEQARKVFAKQLIAGLGMV